MLSVGKFVVFFSKFVALFGKKCGSKLFWRLVLAKSVLAILGLKKPGGKGGWG